jgi:arylsulfatase A-like enzyme
MRGAWISLAVVGVLNAVACLPAAATEPRPNVLWIYLEDVSGWFSCYGERLIETPNIDRLAARGTRFTRFYTSAGVCSATRSAVMLGAMQTTHGVHHHRSSRNDAQGTKHDGIGMIHLPEGVVPLPQWCRQHGVWTFNEGRGKDDFNFVFSHDDFYDYCPAGQGWGPELTVGGPGIPQGAVRDDLASSIDIAPTTLGILGLPAQKHFEGRDLFAAEAKPREFVVAARDRCDYTIEKIRAIVTTTGLIQVLYEWGDTSVNPEYEHLRGVIEPKPKAPAKNPRVTNAENGRRRPNILFILTDDQP